MQAPVVARPVLLVDDNVAHAENLQEILEDEGIDADVAENVDAAIEMLHQRDYGLVVTDMRMPGRNGLELVRHLRDAQPTVPVVCMTAYSADKTLEDALSAGAQTWLSKPVDVDRFVSLAQSAVDASGQDPSDAPRA